MQSIYSPHTHEKLAYINGLLSAVEILHSTSDNIMDHFLVELDIGTDVENAVKQYLKTPRWIFTFTLIDDWKQHLTKNGNYFFTNILTEIVGMDVNSRDKPEFEKYYSRYNLKQLATHLMDAMDDLLKTSGEVKTYSIEIDSSPDPKSGYFAHTENNYLFHAQSKAYFLHFSAYD